MNQLRTIPFITKRPADITKRLSRRPRGKDALLKREVIEHGERFTVEGSEGDDYKVTITNKPSCTCPDSRKPPHFCKHMLFVFLDGACLGLNETDPLSWQSFYMEHELKKIGINLEGPQASSKRPGEDLESSPKRRKGPLTTEGLDAQQVRTLLISTVDKHPDTKQLVDQRRETIVDGLTEKAMREVLLEMAKLHGEVAQEIDSTTEQVNSEVVEFDDEVKEAMRVIHCIDYLRDSQQYERVSEVVEPLQEIIKNLPQRLNSFSSLASRKNALSALRVIGMEMLTEASNQVSQALLHGDGPVEQLEAAIVGVLDELAEGKERDDAFQRLQELVSELLEQGLGRLNYYIENGEDIEP